MAEALYSNERLYTIAQENYTRLSSYCRILESDGYWEEPGKIMKKNTQDVLDLYVQSLLLHIAAKNKNLKAPQRKFIIAIPSVNVLDIEADTRVSQDIIDGAERFASLPPILLQLCSVYDKDRKDNFTDYFLDSLLNIILCMARLDGAKGEEVNAFIEEYYEKIQVFIQKTEDPLRSEKQYISRKLHSEEIGNAVKWFRIEQKTETKKEVVGLCQGQVLVKETESTQGKKKKKKKVEENKIQIEQEKKKEEEKSTEVECIEIKEEEENEEDLQKEAKEQFLQVKKRIKQRELQQEKERQARIDAVLKELNDLVGLDEVKTEINSLINLIKVRKLREIMKMPSMDMSYHMVFTGNPGTGKTTVARLVAKIYQELGILSKGTLIETDRSGLVAGYVGQTALKVKEVVESALGGVLFIDEAYALSSQGNANDFGNEVLDTLVKMMEDHRDDLVVIVAGYPKEMDEFLKANTGLISRFNRFISFEDYSVDELVEILQVMAKNAGLVVTQEALVLVRKNLESMTEEEVLQFGNARGIRNMFEKIVVNQANRIVEIVEPTEEILRTILPEDI